MHNSTIRRAALAALLLAACDSSTGSEPLDGVYLAQTANGRALPAVMDSLPWNDGQTYTLQRLVAASVEFLDDENARYTYEERVVAYHAAFDSVGGGHCRSVTVPYRSENGSIVLVVEPALYGDDGPLRLDTLQLQNGRLVQTIRSETGKAVNVEFARAQQPARCSDPFPSARAPEQP